VPYRMNLPAIPESRHKALLKAYRPYYEAMRAKPYDPDRVQAFGLAFYDAFIAAKDFICVACGIPQKEFEYSLHHKVMPIIQFRFGDKAE
jgi:hypothetical protein